MAPNASPNQQLRAAVIGATGYAGAELVRILAGHPGFELACLTSRQYTGVPLSQVYPAFSGVVDMVCEEYVPDRVMEKADIIFTALPHKLPMDIVPGLLDAGKKVVDLSADFRFADQSRYEAHYQPHAAPDLLARAVYGLSEIYAEKIAAADLVGNPGCYPTCSMLPLIPFVQKGWIDAGSIVIDAKSGASGAGRGASVATLYCEVTEGFRAYKVAEHRHNPEMEEVLSREAGVEVALTFVPHLVPMSRGMLCTSYSQMTDKADAGRAVELLKDYYADAPFVRVLEPGQLPQTRNVRGMNFCDIAVKVDERTNRLILVSVIDNLVKGAAGQAVQNANLMAGYDQAAGLNQTPFPV